MRTIRMRSDVKAPASMRFSRYSTPTDRPCFCTATHNTDRSLWRMT
jgi:hypothetical protein